LQLDTKIDGIPADVLADALNQAKEARLKILEVMASAIPEPREDVGENAPKILSFEIPVEKIGEVIGPKGKMINTIQAESGAEITVDDDGMSGIVSIASPDREKVAEAERQIMLIVDPPSAHVGEVYEGRVVNITKFGAFVNILPGRDGLVHISKLGGGKRIDRVEDVLALGDAIEVEVEDIDPNGKISLRPLLDDDRSPKEKSSETIEEDEISDNDEDSSESDDFNQKDTASNDRGDESKSTTSASFEDAFQAELEAVHGDLGKSSSRRSGERKRR
jgi:polyribonucleotide nucleotidyltransferase